MPDLSEVFRFHRFLLRNTGSRVGEYARAIAAKVKPGDVVLDLGCGTGILSFLACQAGAAKVYAVEPGDIIELAKLVSAPNGFSDRIEFIQKRSSEISLPRRADVLISDLFGTFGLQEGGLAAIIDARERLLKPEASLIPESLRLFLTPIEVPDTYSKEIDSWHEPVNEIDFSVVRPSAVNNCYAMRFGKETFLAKTDAVCSLNFSELEEPLIKGEIAFDITRQGIMHGLGGWFAAQLSEDVLVANDPVATSSNYAQAFFPLDSPLPVNEGDQVATSFQSHDGAILRWRVQHSTTSFDQSTFLAIPQSPNKLRKYSADFKPKLSRLGQAELFAMRCFAEDMAVGEVEAGVMEEFPDQFRSALAARIFVRLLLERSS